jgi:hypothetical protein
MQDPPLRRVDLGSADGKTPYDVAPETSVVSMDSSDRDGFDVGAASPDASDTASAAGDTGEAGRDAEPIDSEAGSDTSVRPDVPNCRDASCRPVECKTTRDCPTNDCIGEPTDGTTTHGQCQGFGTKECLPGEFRLDVVDPYCRIEQSCESPEDESCPVGYYCVVNEGEGDAEKAYWCSRRIAPWTWPP